VGDNKSGGNAQKPPQSKYSVARHLSSVFSEVD
jgi:hypothetical protein